jgi:hypothetical protein
VPRRYYTQTVEDKAEVLGDFGEQECGDEESVITVRRKRQ